MSDPLSLAIQTSLAGDPNDIALEFHGVEVSWSYVRNVAYALDALLNDAGLREGAPIYMAPRNRPSFCAAVLSLLSGRRSVAMAYAFKSPTALAADIARQKCQAVILDVQDWNVETLAAVAPTVLAIGIDSALDAKQPVRVMQGQLQADRSGLRETTAAPLLEMLTSGTTGAPKRHAVSYQTIQTAIITGNVMNTGERKPEPGYVLFPLSNISGIYTWLTVAVGRSNGILAEKFDLGEWVAFVRKHKPVTAILPPAGLRMILDQNVSKDEIGSLRYLFIGMTGIDLATHIAFEDQYKIGIVRSYGATEFCGAATAMTPGEYDQFGGYGKSKFGTVGRPTKGNAVKVVDPDTGAELPPGQDGLLLVRIGALGDDFMRTTDLGCLDEDGYLYVKGRIDGVIMRGGFKIMPSTIEAALNSFPGVSVSTAIGIPDQRLGQVPVAAVEMKPGFAKPDAAALEAHLRAQIPATHIPVAYKVLDAMPRNASVKVDLGALRAMFQDS
jgi:acyl-CoA synthetase (AMP-forming)/AMP-acid ligase II